MGYSKKIRRPGRPVEIEPEELLARRARYQTWFPAQHAFESVVRKLRGTPVEEEQDEEDPPYVEALRELESTLWVLSQSMMRACDGIDDLVGMLDERWPVPEPEETIQAYVYPEPVYYGGPRPSQYELWSNGLAAEYIRTDGDDDIPF